MPADAVAVLLSAGAPDAPALLVPEGERMFTYAELAEETTRLAGLLRTLGVERGDRVALVLPNGPEYLQVLLAITSLGAAAAPLNPAYTREEYAFYLDDLDPRLLLLPAREAPAARAAAGEGLRVGEVAIKEGRIAGVRERDRVPRRGTSFEPAEPDDIALLLHTSGTTSRPKQVPLLHRNLLASARTIVGHYRLGGDDISYCAMPLFHVHGLVASTLSALLAGGSAVVPRRFSPRQFWQHLRRFGVTWFSAAPTLYEMVLERAGPHDGTGGRVRFLRSCSSALSPDLFGRVEERFGAPLLEAYGMTEASHQIASNPLPPEERVPGSVGLPTGTEIRVVDERGGRFPHGAAGEVVIRGAGVTPGYLNNPKANAEAFVDGWFRTGDWGVLDERGYLRLQGRLKEMIIRGGENISPYEIENVLRSHPSVVDAVCFGVPDKKYGEQVAAAVTLGGSAERPELADYCRERLAAFKVPRVIHVLDEIPRTPTGKVQRARVAALLERGR